MSEQAGKHYIQCNLPLTEEDYRSGNGEGVWVIVDSETKQAYDQDAEGSGYRGILDNDSYNYPGLCHGEEVEIEMRGENRPVIPLSFLKGRTRL